MDVYLSVDNMGNIIWRGCCCSRQPSVLVGTIKQLLPDPLLRQIQHWYDRLNNYFFPAVYIRINEFLSADLDDRKYAYIAVENYLSCKTLVQSSVMRLIAESVKKKGPLLFTSADYEEIEDEFDGVKVKWYKGKHSVSEKVICKNDVEKSYYCLSFHPKHREIVMKQYLDHVLVEGKKLKKQRKQRKILMNS